MITSDSPRPPRPDERRFLLLCLHGVVHGCRGGGVAPHTSAAIRAGDLQGWRRGYRQLQAYPLSHHCLCGGEHLVLDTHPVRLTECGRAATIGRFRLILTPSRGDIQLVNLEGRREGCDHPHVVEGRPVSDELVEAAAALCAQGGLADAMLSALKYLASYDPATAQLALRAWDDPARCG